MACPSMVRSRPTRQALNARRCVQPAAWTGAGQLWLVGQDGVAPATRCKFPKTVVTERVDGVLERRFAQAHILWIRRGALRQLNRALNVWLLKGQVAKQTVKTTLAACPLMDITVRTDEPQTTPGEREAGQVRDARSIAEPSNGVL
jgi:hypothetical protein